MDFIGQRLKVTAVHILQLIIMVIMAYMHLMRSMEFLNIHMPPVHQMQDFILVNVILVML